MLRLTGYFKYETHLPLLKPNASQVGSIRRNDGTLHLANGKGVDRGTGQLLLSARFTDTSAEISFWSFG